MTKTKVIGPYELGKTLGKGTYSTVKRAVHMETGTEVAIKIAKKDCDPDDIDREIAILKLLKHPNIVRLLDVIHDAPTSRTYLAFELVSGDLFDYTIARGHLAEREARRIMRELVSAVAHCHAHMVVHRDLKLENVLMDKDGHARIADFGLSSIMKPGMRMNTFCGSPMYMSPEIVQGLGYGTGVDIWSLGVMLYSIVVGVTPWKVTKGVVDDLDTLLKGEFTIPEHIKLSPSCRDLINMMLVPDRATRASIDDIMQHPWLMEGYDQPIRLLVKSIPSVEVNEIILKQMVNMGYPLASTHKAVTENIPSPALMVYHRMFQEMEEECNLSPRVQPAYKTHHRRSSGGSPLSAVKARTRRCSSGELPLFLAASVTPPSPVKIAPPSRRSLLPISEEFPVPDETEHGASAPVSPSNSPPTSPVVSRLPRLRLGGTNASSAPTSPMASPPLSPFTEELPVVRGAFNVATTTLKPRRALFAEIARALDDAGISHTLIHTTFECTIGEEKSKDGTDVVEKSKDGTDAEESEGRKDEALESDVTREGKAGGELGKEDTARLKFEIEICRVSGLEMLLAIRFRRVVGDALKYQEACNKLMATTKL